MGFKEDLAAAKAKVSDGSAAKSPVIEAVLNETVYELVFHKATPVDWSHATMKHLPRPDVSLDLRNGYNLSGASREISAKYGRRIEDGAEVELPADDWVDLWEAIEPATARVIEANIWHLHEHDAEQEIQRAKKASKPRPASRKKPS